MNKFLNNRGSVSNGVALSIGIHATLLILLVFSSEIKQLPLIKDLIQFRTATDFKKTDPIEAGSEIAVSYVEPEKSPISNTKEKVPAPTIKNKEDVLSPPAAPVSRPKKSKVKTVLAKSKQELPPVVQKDEEIIDDSEELLKDVPPPPMADIGDEFDELEGEENNSAQAANSDLKENIDQRDPVNEALPEQRGLVKNPNPPQEESFTDSQVNDQAAKQKGPRDFRRVKQMAGNPKHKYPETAKFQKVQGTVVLKYNVTNSGNVKDIRVVESSGSPLLDDEALDTIKKWKFQPGQAGENIHQVRFKLNGPAKQRPSRLRTSSSSSNG